MIRLIVATDIRRGIAKHGGQPWYLPADEQYFNEQTTSHSGIVLMGQKTFEVIGRPLPDRRNFVLSREMRPGDGVTYVQDIDRFLQELQEDLWVIGGLSVYEQTLPLADELYITHIDADFGCDVVFPEYEHSFELKQTSDLHTQNGFIFTYSVYTKL